MFKYYNLIYLYFMYDDEHTFSVHIINLNSLFVLLRRTSNQMLIDLE